MNLPNAMFMLKLGARPRVKWTNVPGPQDIAAIQEQIQQLQSVNKKHIGHINDYRALTNILKGKVRKLEPAAQQAKRMERQLSAGERQVQSLHEKLMSRGEEIQKLKGLEQKFWPSMRRFAPKVLLGGALMGGLYGAQRLAGRIREKATAKRNFRAMMHATPALRTEESPIVKSRFRTLQRVAPTLASDPLVAGSIVRQWVEYPTVTATALADVVKVEKDLRGEINPISLLTRAAGSLALGSGS